jgi:hypothetical protein
LLVRHHFSLLSAAVLIAALAIALTSSSFSVPSGNAPGAASEAAMLLDRRQTVALPPPEERLLVYYLIDSLDQQRSILNAMANDAIYRGMFGVPELETTVSFLYLKTPSDEAHAARIIHQVAESAPYEGFQLKVVDLTQDTPPQP